MAAPKHNDFSAGQVQDAARHLLPEKAVWEAFDAILQEDGTIAQRGAAITAMNAASVISPAHGMILDSSPQLSPSGILYDDSAGAGAPVKVAAFPPSAGIALTTLSAVLSLTLAGSSVNGGPGWVTPSGGGRPVRYFDRILRPNGIPLNIAAAHEYRPFSIYGGAAFGKTAARVGTNTITLTQNDPILTGFIAADTAAVEVGMVARFSDNTHHYSGRIVEIPSPTTLRFSPTPLFGTWNTGVVQWVIAPISSPTRRTVTNQLIGARALAAWGDRIILGGVAYDMTSVGTKLDVKPNRIVWGLLPAVDSTAISTVTSDGWRESNLDTFLPLDFTDVMGMSQILGLEPVNGGELLVLGQPRCYRIVGFFSTQTTQVGGGLTWEVRPVEDAVPCISDLATSTTPQGIMFAGPDGIYLYHGGRAKNVMDSRIRNLWQASLQAGATVTGGGYIGQNTYCVSTTAGMWLCNMDGFRWTTPGMSSVGGAIQDPTKPGRYYGIRYNPGTANDTTKLFRLDCILTPSVTFRVDANPGWAGPAIRIRTRVYTEGDPSRLKRTNHVYLTARMPGSSGTLTVTSTPGLDAEEAGATLGTMATGTSAQFKRFPIYALSRGMALTIEKTAGTPDEVELIGLKLASVPLNEHRDT